MSKGEDRGKYSSLLRTVVVTGGAFMINYLIQLLLTPFVTRHVGIEAYGFVTLARNFSQYAAILTMALNSFAARHIAVAYHNNHMERANCYFSSVFFGDVVFAAGIMSIALVLILNLDHVFHISPELVSDVRILFLMVFVNFSIITVFTVFESAAYIKNRLDVTGLFKGLSYVNEALVLILLFNLFRAKVQYVGIGLIAASLTVVLGNICITRRYTPDLRIEYKSVSLDAIKNLVVNGIWTSVNALGDVLNNGLDLLVCNLMLTPLHMGQLAVAKTMHTMFSGLFVIINPAFQPMFLKSYAKRDMTTFLDEMKLAMRVSGLLANLAFAGFAALGLAFYQLWIPQENTQLIYQLTMINMVTLISGGPVQPLFYIYILTLKRKIPSLIAIIGGFCNVIGMYLLIRYTGLGVYAVVLTTAVIMTVINFITNPLYMAHVLKLPLYTFFPGMFRNVICCVILTILFKGISILYTPVTWPILYSCAVFYILLGIGVQMLLLFDHSDRKRIWMRLKTKIM